MPRRNEIAKILIIGSDPIVIGYLFKDFMGLMEECKG
jgi:hypothetical protein